MRATSPSYTHRHQDHAGHRGLYGLVTRGGLIQPLPWGVDWPPVEQWPVVFPLKRDRRAEAEQAEQTVVPESSLSSPPLPNRPMRLAPTTARPPGRHRPVLSAVAICLVSSPLRFAYVAALTGTSSLKDLCPQQSQTTATSPCSARPPISVLAAWNTAPTRCHRCGRQRDYSHSKSMGRWP